MSVRDHVLVGVVNPYLICEQCKTKVSYRHNLNRCPCNDTEIFNAPCGHAAEVLSKCPSWDIIEGCLDGNTHED